MKLYYIFSAAILTIQFIQIVQAVRHTLYTARKYKPGKISWFPRVAVISPCKGLENTFDRNINSLFHMDYPSYEIHFVVESETDPAYARLQEVIARQNREKNTVTAHIHVAGLAEKSSQKVHNLRYAYSRLSGDIEAIVFVDSDACFKPHFLGKIVKPLVREKVGAATGYRWFVPTDNRLSSQVLSAINAFFASMLGPHPWNSAWGGAMAIKKDLFERLNLPKIWETALTDDYTLTRAVRQAGWTIRFVPSCFIASYEQMDWLRVIAFIRRQFIITRRYMPLLWLTAVLGIGHFVLAFWLGAIVTGYLIATGSSEWIYANILPTALYIMALMKAATRQILIRKILPEDRRRLSGPALLDIFLQPLLAVFTWTLLLSTAFSRTITWRGIRYEIHKDVLQITKPLR